MGWLFGIEKRAAAASSASGKKRVAPRRAVAVEALETRDLFSVAMPTAVPSTNVEKTPAMYVGLLREHSFAESRAGNDRTDAQQALSVSATHSYAGRPPKPLPAVSHGRSDKPEKAPRSLRVLVVEDDSVARTALMRILRSQGWEAVGAATAREAIMKLETAKPDAVLLDLMLPDGAGETVVEHARHLPRPAHVIVMTGSHDVARLDRVAELGIDSLLVKPVNVNELVSDLSAMAAA